jgi:hypothetical protein
MCGESRTVAFLFTLIMHRLRRPKQRSTALILVTLEYIYMILDNAAADRLMTKNKFT